MTLSERIERGQQAIAEAKAAGKHVNAWEERLAELKALAQAEKVGITVGDVLRVFGGGRVLTNGCLKCGEPWTPYTVKSSVPNGHPLSLNVCWCEVKKAGTWITKPWEEAQQVSCNGK